MENVIEKGAQVSQSLNVECVDHFAILPKLVVQFVINNVPHKFDLQLPITINKFFEPTSMNSEQFFQRWKNLNKYVFLIIFRIFIQFYPFYFVFCQVLDKNRRKYSSLIIQSMVKAIKVNLLVLVFNCWRMSIRILKTLFVLPYFTAVKFRLVAC